MKKITFLLFVIFAFQSEKLQAQVYKRIIGIDSVGYYKNYPPTLHSGFRFTYPNKTVGNREEVRSLYRYYVFPNNLYQDCNIYSLFRFSTLRDTARGSDTTHNLSRTNNVLAINNKEKVLSTNGRTTSYYNGTDTSSRFYYNSNGQMTSEVYKSNNYNIKQITYQYNSQNKLAIYLIELTNSTDRYYTLYKYNGSGILIEETDSWKISGNIYVTRNKFKKVGSVLIKNIDNGTSNSDDSMYYNSSGLLDSIKSSSTYGTNTFYYYDSSGYLDSVVYERYSQTDKVILYWETYTPNSSGIIEINTANANSVAIYPNPSNGNFNIELSAAKTTMTIINSLGQTVKEATLTQGINTIDVAGLVKGIYSIRFGELKECRKIVIE